MSAIKSPIDQLRDSEKKKKRGRLYEAERQKALKKLREIKSRENKTADHFKRRVGGL